MDNMQIGVQLLQRKIGLGDDQSGNLMSALGGLTRGGDGIDIAGLVSKMQGGGGLADMASSWLGDGQNEAISGSQVSDLLGADKISEFASKLNIDEETAKSGLVDMLPQVIDKSSPGGSLLDSVGGVSGLMGMARKFLK